jgi:hypothetical protein
MKFCFNATVAIVPPATATLVVKKVRLVVFRLMIKGRMGSMFYGRLDITGISTINSVPCPGTETQLS